VCEGPLLLASWHSAIISAISHQSQAHACTYIRATSDQLPACGYSCHPQALIASFDRPSNANANANANFAADCRLLRRFSAAPTGGGKHSSVRAVLISNLLHSSDRARVVLHPSAECPTPLAPHPHPALSFFDGEIHPHSSRRIVPLDV